MRDYQSFLAEKMQLTKGDGFEPIWMPDFLFDFQVDLVEWAIRKGRAAIFADCGLGKTPMQLVWAQNVLEKTNRPILILTPLAVAQQTEHEADKCHIAAKQCRNGKHSGGIVITNYERLHYFDPTDFSGVVCDESSILKNFAGKFRQAITDFMSHCKYRLLCTATAAPNDYVELGTSCEALGVMERRHMLSHFFTHDGSNTSSWRLKGHARETAFWRWICSWARAIRKPSDLGYSDQDFLLPDLMIRDHIVSAAKPLDGYLFDIPANGLSEQREDLRRTLHERCEMAAEQANSHSRPVVCWTNLNVEADLLEKLVNDSVNVQGSDSDDYKEESFVRFSNGDVRAIISKPTIAGFGLNWQHCAHMTFFPSHSYEQFYQCVRRCFRFGQCHRVIVDMITTDGQSNVLNNIRRKSAAAERMFQSLVDHMNASVSMNGRMRYTIPEEVPAWL